MLKPEHICISLSHRSDLLATEVRSNLSLHCSELIDDRDVQARYNSVANVDLYKRVIRNLVYAMYAKLYQEVRDKLREIISQVADISTLSYEDARRLLHSLQDAHSTTCPRGEDIENLVMSVLGSMHDTEAARGAIRQILGTRPDEPRNAEIAIWDRELTPGDLPPTSEAQVPNQHVGNPGELEEAKKFVREFLSEVDSDDPGEIWRESR